MVVKFFNWLAEVFAGCLLTIVGGAVLAKMWGWFIAPKFHIPGLSWIDGVGIFLIINLLLIGVYFKGLQKDLLVAAAARKEQHMREVMAGEKEDFDIVDLTPEGADWIVRGFKLLFILCGLLFAWAWHFFL